MKNHIKWILLIGVAGIAVMALAQGAPGQKIAPAIGNLQELQNQVVQLCARVQALESRTQKLESEIEEMRFPHPMPLVVPPANLPATPPSMQIQPQGSRPPTIWGEKKVNGWTFYIVPCEQQDH